MILVQAISIVNFKENRKNSASKTYSNSHGGLKLNKNGSQSVSREQGGCLHILKEETFSDHWGKDAIGDEAIDG